MAQAGIDEKSVYLTNTIKHFKFIVRGKRRIHQKPKSMEIEACAPWLEGELAAIRPRLVVALGATAAQALLRRSFRLTHHRGEIVTSPRVGRVLATIHPSSVLRAPDAAARRREQQGLLKDLELVARLLA
jgi:uracil-DNA glycosylase family 4